MNKQERTYVEDSEWRRCRACRKHSIHDLFEFFSFKRRSGLFICLHVLHVECLDSWFQNVSLWENNLSVLPKRNLSQRFERLETSSKRRHSQSKAKTRGTAFLTKPISAAARWKNSWISTAFIEKTLTLKRSQQPRIITAGHEKTSCTYSLSFEKYQQSRFWSQKKT